METTAMTEAEVVKLMASSASEVEWNANCDRVKRAFDGDYPRFWYRAIVQSGLASRTAMGFRREYRRAW